MRIPHLVPALLLTLAAAAPLFAQADEPPCPRAALEKLAFLEGTWEVEARLRLSASPATWETTAATSRVERAMFGCLLIERLSGRRRGAPFEAVRIFAAKPDGKLQLAMTDSAHGPIFLYEGSVEPEGATYYYRLENAQGPVIVRLRVRDDGTGTYVIETHRSADDGKSWDSTGTSRYTRRKP